MSNLKRRTFDEGEKIVAQYEQSGMSQRKFAAALGIPFSAVRYWVGRIREVKKRVESSSAVRFLEVVPNPKPAASRTSRVKMPGGITLQTEELPSPEYLAELSASFQRRFSC